MKKKVMGFAEMECSLGIMYDLMLTAYSLMKD